MKSFLQHKKRHSVGILDNLKEIYHPKNIYLSEKPLSIGKNTIRKQSRSSQKTLLSSEKNYERNVYHTKEISTIRKKSLSSEKNLQKTHRKEIFIVWKKLSSEIKSKKIIIKYNNLKEIYHPKFFFLKKPHYN